MTEPILEIKNGVKQVSNGLNEQKTIMDHLNLRIQPGEFVTVLGGNGAGKSTLFNSISGHLSLSDGQVFIKGEDVTKLREEERAKMIARVFQDPKMGTAPRMTVAENLLLAMNRGQKRRLTPRGLKEKRGEFAALCQQLGNGLEAHLDTPTGELSGGQRQGLSLLMATIRQPDLLLLDEHTAALDPKTARNLMEMTRQQVESNHLTCLMITHRLEDALVYGNRLIVLEKGRVKFDINGKDIGFRKGDSVTIDLTGLFGNSNGYNSDVAWKESPTNYNGMHFLPGSDEQWFVIDAADTISNKNKNQWIRDSYRSANNTPYNAGLMVTTTLNQQYSGTTEDGLFSWKVEHGYQWRPQSITVTRNKTTFSDGNMTSILKFGKVEYANEVNTRDWTGNGWKNRAGEKRWGHFYPQVAVSSSGAPELKVSQKSKPVVREGERVQDILDSEDFNVSDYLDVTTASSDSKIEYNVIDSSIILDGKNSRANLEIVETLDGLTRTKTINFIFDIKEYTLNMNPLTNLTRKLTDTESISENKEVSKLDSPVTTALNGPIELESDMHKYGDYELLAKFSGSGISTEKYVSLTGKEQKTYSFDEKLGNIKLFAGKQINIELLYRQAGEDRVVRKLKTIVPLDATPPDGTMVDEVVTTIGEVPDSKKIATDLKDETSNTVGVSYVSDIDKLVSEPSAIKDGVVSLKELSMKLKDEAGNTRQLKGNVLAVLAEKIWIEVPNSIELSSKELI